MGTNGEYWADGVPQCECGCTDLIVRLTKQCGIMRNKELNVTSEYYDEGEDEKILCRNCKTVIA